MIDNVDVLIRQGFRIPTPLLAKKTASSIGLIKTKKLLKTNGKKSINIVHYNDFEEFLSHHGVKGQKWGVQNEKNNKNHLNTKNISWFKKHKRGLLIGTAATAVIGGTVVAIILKKKANIKVRDLKMEQNKIGEAKKLLDAKKQIKLKVLHEKYQTTDNTLIKLYKQMEKTNMKDPDSLDKSMLVLDKIMNRRIKLGEISLDDL